MRFLKYKQVKLVKGNTYQITWIPTHLAQIGRPLRIRDNKRAEWEDGWIVVTASDVNMILDERDWGDEDIMWDCWGFKRKGEAMSESEKEKKEREERERLREYYKKHPATSMGEAVARAKALGYKRTSFPGKRWF